MLANSVLFFHSCAHFLPLHFLPPHISLKVSLEGKWWFRENTVQVWFYFFCPLHSVCLQVAFCLVFNLHMLQTVVRLHVTQQIKTQLRNRNSLLSVCKHFTGNLWSVATALPKSGSNTILYSGNAFTFSRFHFLFLIPFTSLSHPFHMEM